MGRARATWTRLEPARRWAASRLEPARRWAAKPPVRWLGMGIAGLVGFAGIGYLVLKLSPDWFAENDRAATRQGVRTANLALLAGAIAVIGAIYTARTFALNRAGQITDRFGKAIEQLGSAELDVRLGGIYALERIARDSADDHPQVMEVLTAFVRVHAPLAGESPSGAAAQSATASSIEAIGAVERIAAGAAHKPGTEASIEAMGAVERIAGSVAGRAPHPNPAPRRPANGPPTDESPRALATDVQAAMSVLARRDASQDQKGADLDLIRTDLPRLTLREGANLRDASLTRADLRGARLDKADLRGARLSEANLQGASLSEANLQGASLVGADLQDAFLSGADLRGASLVGADLQDASLVGADLRDAYLGEANLLGVRYNSRPFEFYSGSTRWPEGFTPPNDAKDLKPAARGSDTTGVGD